MKKSIVVTLLYVSILSQPACTERIAGKGSISGLKPNDQTTGQEKLELSVESPNPQLEISTGTGDITLVNTASCGDQDVTNQIAKVRPEFNFFKDSYLNEAVLTSGPTAIAGLWVTSSHTGKMLPTSNNFIPVAVSKTFATKTNLRAGAALKQLFGLEQTTGQKDIEGSFANALSVYNSSMSGGFVTAQNNNRRVYAGVMTCNRPNQNLNPTPNVPSILHQMQLFNIVLPQAMNRYDFKGKNIPEALYIRMDFSGEKINQVVSGLKLDGAAVDESFGKRSLVVLARELTQAKSYQSLSGEKVSLLNGIQSLLREKRACQSLSGSLPDSDKPWWNEPFGFDREMNLGIACKILAGSDLTTESMIGQLSSRFDELRNELSNRLLRTAIWMSAARSIPSNWSTDTNLRCFASSGLYVNQVLSSVVLPLKKYQGGFAIRGVVGETSHPESNLAFYAPTNNHYFDTRLTPSGEGRGDLKTVFGMFNIRNLPGEGGGLIGKGYTEFDAKAEDFSVEMGIGEILNQPSVDNLIVSPLNIGFKNRALQTLPNGDRNNCGEIGSYFCLKNIGGIIRGSLF